VNLIGKKIKGNKIWKRETSPTRSPAWPNTPPPPSRLARLNRPTRATMQPSTLLLPWAASSLPPSCGPSGTPRGPRTPPPLIACIVPQPRPTPPPSPALGPVATQRGTRLTAQAALAPRSQYAPRTAREGYCSAAIGIVPARWTPYHPSQIAPPPSTRMTPRKHPHPPHLAGLKPHNSFPPFPKLADALALAQPPL
jgi:hypothetical protein